MGLEPIQVNLSIFEKLEILRQEIDLREEELKEAEKSIRQILHEIERQKYLQTVHPLFQHLPPPAEAANLPQLHSNREALHQALLAMKASMQAIEAETGGRPQKPPADDLRTLQQQRPGTGAGGAASRKPKFDSFDDFRNQRQDGR